MDLSRLKRQKDFEWIIPKAGEMVVPGQIFASQDLIEEMDHKVYEQVTNVACLPGIQRFSIAMPDAHWGYGFPIGGVAAFDPQEGGVISVGGVGFDVNCGVRTLKTGLVWDDVKPRLKEIIDALFAIVPAGVGSRGEITLSGSQIEDILTKGAQWVVSRGYGTQEDLDFTEDRGMVPGAHPQAVSEVALRRERRQVGTLGSGNHYLEIQRVDEIYHPEVAEKFGLADQSKTDERPADQDLIDERVEHSAELARHIKPAGGDTVEYIGQAGDDKQHKSDIDKKRLVRDMRRIENHNKNDNR